MPVGRIAEKETPVKIESPEEKVLRKDNSFKKGDRGLKEALRLYAGFVNRYNDMEAPGLILELLTNIFSLFF